MSKNNIIGLVVIMALLIGYSLWMMPSKKEIEESKRRNDSIAAVHKADSVKMVTESAKVVGKADSAKTPVNSPVNVQPVVTDKFGNFAGAAIPEQKFYFMENDLLRLKISGKGGYIYSAELKNFKRYDGKALVLFEGDSTVFGFDFNTSDLKSLNTQQLTFLPAGNVKDTVIRVSGTDSVTFALRLYSAAADSIGNAYIEYVYSMKGNDYMVGFDVRFMNMQPYLAANVRDLVLNWQTDVLQQEKSFKTESTQSSIYYMDNTEDVSYLSETKDAKERITTALKWVSYKDQFFSSTLIADKQLESGDMETASHQEDTASHKMKRMNSAFVVAFDPTSTSEIGFTWYFGPNKYNILRKYHMNLERQIPLGWSFFLMQWINRYAVIPVFNILEKANINYGIIILILTVLLKIVLFPIAYKTYLSSAKMRILKPEVDEINSKYPKKEDAMKKQQATMNLYKKAGVNPMSGCVPMLLQMPILFAMFRFFPASFELRQQPFLWANDLSSYDSIMNLPFTIPFYGNHVSLFTLLMTISTIIYTKINNDMMGSTNQVPGMKTMMYMMPIMFLGFFNSYSSGLSYYYLLANLFTFAQMFFIRRFVSEEKLHARIQENKAKPVKKSSFQKRLEDMAKQQGYKPKK